MHTMYVKSKNDLLKKNMIEKGVQRSYHWYPNQTQTEARKYTIFTIDGIIWGSKVCWELKLEEKWDHMFTSNDSSTTIVSALYERQKLRWQQMFNTCR